MLDLWRRGTGATSYSAMRLQIQSIRIAICLDAVQSEAAAMPHLVEDEQIHL